MVLYTVQDWLNEGPSGDGSKRELILGKIHVSPSASGPHNPSSADFLSAESTDRMARPSSGERQLSCSRVAGLG
jgi:hypothetical protein